MINIGATNYTAFRAKHVSGIKFGSVAWTAAQFASTGSALDTTFTANNATALFDAVGAIDANTPVKSYMFGKDLKISGNERSIEQEDLLGKDTSGAQNAELSTGPNSMLDVTVTLVYRNTTPMSIFNDTTRACLMTFDNQESSTTGQLNIAFNTIWVKKVGEISRDSETGLMTQEITFSCKGGTTSTLAVSQTSPAETWQRVYGGDYAEEIRLA